MACPKCKDTGVIETGNNDLPCSCKAGDKAIFNTTEGQKTGGQIKSERPWAYKKEKRVT